MREEVSPLNAASNLLEHSASSYLRSARHQPVQWHAWGEAAFARAQAEDKPILLDIGAVWCHWCHVMDRESYEDPEIAALINEHFVAVKVDRDERPDVDARYQAAVSAISGQGGWPLTAFLTPDGRPYFGGTYFPRDDRYGRPGIGRVLLAMAQVWRERREEALETAASVMAAIEHNESFSAAAASCRLALVDKIAGSNLVAVRSAQRRLRLAAQVSASRGARSAARSGHEPRQRAGSARPSLTTLEKMARGGVYDQLAGGFHRYSVDEHWVVPHFEKMIYDNTELLRNYVHGFQSFVREDFLDIAREIVAWLDATMTDRERGGFYASQDADVGLDDDGDYFTWTLDEARAVLDPRRLDFAAKLLGHWRTGRHAPQPGQECAARETDRSKSLAQTWGNRSRNFARSCESARSQAAGRARPAPHAVYRPHALHRLECDGGDGLSGSGARAAHGIGAGVRAAHAATGCSTRHGSGEDLSTT